MTKKFLILFQDNLDLYQDPSGIISVQLGLTYQWDLINQDLGVIQIILPENKFNQFLSWSTLCSSMTTWPFTKQVPWFKIPIRYRDIFISRLEKMKEISDSNFG